MHLSEAFSFNSAICGLLGGIGIGAVAAVKLATTFDLMPCTTPHLWSTTGTLWDSRPLVQHLTATVRGECKSKRLVRAAAGFILGSAFVSRMVAPAGMVEHSLELLNPVQVAVGGALVGFGAGLGEGCTSGNGIQGLAALSTASFTFVCIFMGTAVATAILAETGTHLATDALAFAPTLTQVTPLLGIAAAGLAAQALGRSIPQVASFLAGATFGTCLIIAGMNKPSRVIGFLDVSSARGWDPTLAFVMGGGLLVTLPVYQFGRLVAKSIPAVQVWATRPVDALLLLAAVSFGIGWGVTGVCPGPAMVAAGDGSIPGWVFVVSMFGARHVGESIRKVTGKRATLKAN